MVEFVYANLKRIGGHLGLRGSILFAAVVPIALLGRSQDVAFVIQKGGPMKARNGETMRSIMICLTIVVLTAQCFAQCLTENEINTAIETGMKKKKDRHGLNLEDQTKNFLNAMANMNRPAYSQRQEKGFSITVFTPITWIQQMSANAAKEYRSFTATKVTEEMKLPVIAVVVYGRKGKDFRKYLVNQFNMSLSTTKAVVWSFNLSRLIHFPTGSKTSLGPRKNILENRRCFTCKM